MYSLAVGRVAPRVWACTPLSVGMYSLECECVLPSRWACTPWRVGMYSLECGRVYGEVLLGDQCIVRVPCWGCGSPHTMM